MQQAVATGPFSLYFPASCAALPVQIGFMNAQ